MPFQDRGAPSSSGDGPEVIGGIVERVTYHNPENGFCVLRVKVRGRRDLEAVVGHVASIAAGETIHATGRWAHDREHGLQFRATDLRTTAPTSRAGIEKYLASGMIRGIGPVYARKLVEAFGEDVFDVIEQQPERLRTVKGIGPTRIDHIVAAWAEQKAVREIMVFLHSHGVGTSRAVRIFKTYGANAVRLVSENPYRLARDIRGIGFLTADEIAGRLGIEKTALVRARAGVAHVLSEATDDGHCGLPTDDLVLAATKLLGVPRTRVEEALRLEIAEGTVVADDVAGRNCAFLAGLFRAEGLIAERLAHLARGRVPWADIDASRAIPWVEERTKMTLADSQRGAVALALRSKVAVLTGGPGVGKTTLVNALLAIVRVKGMRAALAAPTGRAAKRLSESTGLTAKTIHRLLEIDPVTGAFRRNERHPLECDMLVVDEVSMVDVPLMAALVRAVPDRAALLLVGDVDQLPSVGPGQVLSDTIAAGVFPTVRLTEVFRQASTSRIIVNAHRINQGLLPETASAGAPSDFYFVHVDDAEAAAARIVSIVRDRVRRRFDLDPVRDVQVLCPMNRGVTGARTLNLDLQRALNPSREPFVERFGWRFCVGDKVMQTENDYDRDVYNGDLGIVARIDTTVAELVAVFDGREVVYGFDELDELALAYAATIHKAQGSEYPAVIIPLTTQHYPMLARNLLYTGVTRGRRLVVVVGQRKALAIAVKNTSGRGRWSRLKECLQAAAEQSSRCP